MDFKLLKGKSFVCSWSGGKDACLALYRAIKAGAQPLCLLNMAYDNVAVSRSHGLPLNILHKQCELLNIPLTISSTSNEAYRDNYIDQLRKFIDSGANALVCGDIDLQGHYDWVDAVCSELALGHCQPLWKGNRLDLLNEFLDSGFKATIVSVRNGVLNESYLGKVLDRNLIAEFTELGIDACGEEGEFHTLVTDGPLFNAALELDFEGSVKGEHYTYLKWK